MTIRRNLFVHRLEHVAGSSWSVAALHGLLGPSPATRPPQHQVSVADFWRDATNGFVDLRVQVAVPPTVLPNDAAGLPPASWQTVLSWDTHTWDEARGAIGDLLRTAGPPPAPQPGEPEPLVLLIGTHAVGRAVAMNDVPVAGRTFNIAYLSLAQDHATYCHEVGHLLRLDHPWGAAPLGEYDSPYCVMGSPGQENTIAVTPAPGSTTGIPASLFATAGPRVSAATFERWRRVAGVDLDTVHRREVVLDEQVVLDLTDSFDAPTGGYLVLHPPTWVSQHPEPVVVEIRRPRTDRWVDWDHAFRLDRDVAVDKPGTVGGFDESTRDAAGLVVHTLRSVTVPGVERRVVDGIPLHEGTISLPLVDRRDLEVAGSGMRVTVLGWNEDTGTATVRAALLTAPAVSVTAVTRTTASRRTWAGRVRLALTGPRCQGEKLDRYVVEREQEALFVAVASGGNDRDRFAWTLCGQPLGFESTPTDERVSGRLTVALPVATDQPDGSTVVTHRPVAVAWSVRGGQLLAAPEGHDGRFELSAGVSVAGYGKAAPLTATATALLCTRSIEVPGAGAAREACTTWLFKRALEEAPELLHGVVLDRGPLRRPPIITADERSRLLAGLDAARLGSGRPSQVRGLPLGRGRSRT